MFYSIIIFLIIFGLSVVTLYKILPLWVKDDKNNINWGAIIGYSALFGAFGGISFQIIISQHQLGKKTKKKEWNLYEQ